MASTVLTSKGQITLPKAIRDRLALKQGERLRVAVASNGRVTLQRESRPPIDGVYGMLRGLARRRPVTVAEMHQALRQRARAKSAKDVS